MKEKIGTICIILAGVLWGTMGIFVRGLSAVNLSSMEIVTLRSFVALLFMLVIILVKKPSYLRIRLKDVWCFVGTGVVSLTFFNYCYFTTIRETSMAVAAILLYTSPVFIVLFSAILFKEPITRRKVIAMAIALIGCGMVTGILNNSQSALSVKGLLIGLGAGVGYALYSIFGRYAINKGYNSLTITFYTLFFATIATCCIESVPSIISKVTTGNVGMNCLYSIGIALAVTVIPYLLYTKGLESVDNGKAGIMASIEPIVAAVLGGVIFSERITFSGIVGIALVVGAIVLLNIKCSKDRK